MTRPTRTLALLALLSGANAFVAPTRTIAKTSATSSIVKPFISLASTPTSDDTDEEIIRLRSLASKLRAEASALEAEKAQQMANAAERAFRKFDVNNDGEISLEELKLGLERELKVRPAAAAAAQH